MKTLEGKVAVITGGSSGIGLATAKLFRDSGAKVAISGRNQKVLDDAIKKLGAGVVAVRSDVSKLSDLDTLFNLVVKKLGRIDVHSTAQILRCRHWQTTHRFDQASSPPG